MTRCCWCRKQAARIINADSVDGATVERIQHPPVSTPRGTFDFAPLDDYRQAQHRLARHACGIARSGGARLPAF